MEGDSQEEERAESDSQQKKRAKTRKEKPGIIYLSSVPDFMSAQKLRQTFQDFGEVQRTFFQPIEKSYNFKKGLLFSEGWVEFRDKSDAKLAAKCLNNTQVGGKKRHPWYNCIWNIKYLTKFLWTDVNADKELQRRTHESRIRAEIAQAKKQTNFYAGIAERGQTIDSINKKRELTGKEKSSEQIVKQVKQRLTEDEVTAAKKRRREQKGDGRDKKKLKTLAENEKSHKFVMSSIFGGSS